MNDPDPKLVSLAKWQEEHTPTLQGSAICLSCRHRWRAVMPLEAGVVWIECPQCLLMRGRFINPVERDGLHWTCNCGNDLFYAMEHGMYCPNCGSWQKGF